MGERYVNLIAKGANLSGPSIGGKMNAVASADEIGGRVSEWLRSTYPRDGAKLAAVEFGASPNTTKKWFSGVMPENKHFHAMAARWGWRFLSFIYEGVIPPRDEELGAELEDIKQRMARLEGRIKGNPNVGGLAQ